MDKVPVALVVKISTAIQKSHPAGLAITAYGLVPTGGWAEASLEPYLGPLDPPPDTINFDLVATPPTGPVTQTPMLVEASFRVYPMPEELKTVCVHGATNAITVAVGHSSPDPTQVQLLDIGGGGEKPFPLGVTTGGGGDKPFPLGRRT